MTLLLLGLHAPLAAGTHPAPILDRTSESATFAVIGGALCLISLRLRQRKNQ